MKPQLTIPQWLSLEPAIKSRLISLFNIPRTGTTHVVDNKVTTDGYNHNDLSNITVEKLQSLLDSDSKDFFELFNEMIDTIRKESGPKVQPVIITPQDVKTETSEGEKSEQNKEGSRIGDAPKKRGPKKA